MRPQRDTLRAFLRQDAAWRPEIQSGRVCIVSALLKFWLMLWKICFTIFIKSSSGTGATCPAVPTSMPGVLFTHRCAPRKTFRSSHSWAH